MAITVTGVLLEHRHAREAWAVGRLELTEAHASRRVGHTLTVVGPRLGLAAPGELLRLTGDVEHTRYGEQLVIAEQASLGVQAPAQAHRWLERLDGVGPRLAARLYDAFGDEILTLLRNPPPEGAADPLCDVPGIGPIVAQTIRESWGQVGASGSPEDLQYLDGLGLTRFETNNVLQFAKQRATPPRELLEQDPYSLTRVRGFGWKRADVVARKAGAAAECPARLETAAEFAALEACDGDTLVSLGQLVRQTVELTGCRDDLVLDAIGRLSRTDRLTITVDDAGRRWCHPPELVAAERAIWRVVRAQAAEPCAPGQARGATTQGAGGDASVQRDVEVPAAAGA